MKVAIQTPPEHTDYISLRDIWQAADGLGFHAAFTFDHLVPLNQGQRPGLVQGVPDGPQLEGWATLCALAALTENLHVGTLVSGVTYRHPAMLAKMAVTLDHITAGRAILGVGAAWHAAEHAMYGIPFPEVGERMGRLDETLQIFHSLCHQDATTFAGRWYQLNDAVFDPKPVRPAGVPVLVGGSGPRLKRIAARSADLFNSFSAPWEWEGVNAELDELMRAAGREPGALTRTAFVFAELSGDLDAEQRLVTTFQTQRGGTEHEVRSRVLVGSPDDMRQVLDAYANAGVEMVIVNLRPPLSVKALERFAREVLTGP